MSDVLVEPTFEDVMEQDLLIHRANEQYRLGNEAAGTALQHYWAVGANLTALRALCPHGTWLTTLDGSFDGGRKTAYRCITIFERWAEIEPNLSRVTNLSIRGALELLEDNDKDDDEEQVDPYSEQLKLLCPPEDEKPDPIPGPIAPYSNHHIAYVASFGDERLTDAFANHEINRDAAVLLGKIKQKGLEQTYEALWEHEHSDAKVRRSEPQLQHLLKLAESGNPDETTADLVVLAESSQVKSVFEGHTVRQEERDKLSIHYSSETSKWNTPPHILELVAEVLGEIDLDPCSNEGEPNVKAKAHYTETADGLSKAWAGRVYMNPPYGDEITHWTTKLHKAFEAGDVTEAIALVPARPDTAWFRLLRSHPRCFIKGRLKFGDSEQGAPFPSVAIYFGHNLNKFAEVFKRIGDIYVLFDA